MSAATIAVSYLPWVVAAPLLSGLGDRYPRRQVMAFSEVYRMVVCATLAIPGVPIGVLLALLFLLTCGEPPFRSARNAVFPDIFGEEQFARGQSIITTVGTALTFAGYALGGLVVAGLGARGALALDAATFGVSALALRGLLRARPAPVPTGTAARSRTGFALIRDAPVARNALTIGFIVQSFDTVAVGLAVPWAHQLGHGAELAGLLVAASVLGGVVGNIAVSRAADRARLMVPLALLMFALLVPFVIVTSPALSLLLLFLAGVCTGLQIAAWEVFIMGIPAEARARAGGAAGIVLNLGQGVAVLAAGALADGVRPSIVVGIAGAVGFVVMAVRSLTPMRRAEPAATRGSASAA